MEWLKTEKWCFYQNVQGIVNSKKSKFIKGPETKGLLHNLLGVRIQILGDIPFVITLF